MKTTKITSIAMVLVLAAGFAVAQSASGGSGSASGKGGSSQSSATKPVGSDVQPAAEAPVVPAESLQNALYAVGSLGSSNLYFLYVALGMLGDSYANSLYDAKTTSSLVANLADLAKLSRSALGDLLNSPVIQANDEATIQKMTDAYGLLLNQADGLQNYVDKKDDGSAYQKYRKQAWEKISDVLGLSSAGAPTGGSGDSGAPASGSDTGR